VHHFSLAAAATTQLNLSWIASLCVVANALPLADWKAAIFLLLDQLKHQDQKKLSLIRPSALAIIAKIRQFLYCGYRFKIGLLVCVHVLAGLPPSSAHFTTTSSALKHRLF